MKKIKKPLKDRLIKVDVSVKDEGQKSEEDIDSKTDPAISHILTPIFFLKLFVQCLGVLLLCGIVRELLAHTH